MRKLKLKANYKHDLEASAGNHIVKFKPNKIVSVENDDVADYLLTLEQVMEVKESQDATEEKQTESIQTIEETETKSDTKTTSKSSRNDAGADTDKGEK